MRRVLFCCGDAWIHAERADGGDPGEEAVVERLGIEHGEGALIVVVGGMLSDSSVKVLS